MEELDFTGFPELSGFKDCKIKVQWMAVLDSRSGPELREAINANSRDEKVTFNRLDWLF